MLIKRSTSPVRKGEKDIKHITNNLAIQLDNRIKNIVPVLSSQVPFSLARKPYPSLFGKFSSWKQYVSVVEEYIDSFNSDVYLVFISDLEGLNSWCYKNNLVIDSYNSWTSYISIECRGNELLFEGSVIDADTTYTRYIYTIESLQQDGVLNLSNQDNIEQIFAKLGEEQDSLLKEIAQYVLYKGSIIFILTNIYRGNQKQHISFKANIVPYSNIIAPTTESLIKVMNMTLNLGLVNNGKILLITPAGQTHYITKKPMFNLYGWHLEDYTYIPLTAGELMDDIYFKDNEPKPQKLEVILNDT